MRVILNAVPYDRNASINFVPDHEIVVSGAREIELMEAQRMLSGKFVD